MKIALSAADYRDGTLLSQMKKTLDSLNIDTQVMKDGNYKLAKEVDLILSLVAIEVFLIIFIKL